MQCKLVEKLNLKNSFTCLQNLPSREHAQKCISKFTKQATHQVVALLFIIYWCKIIMNKKSATCLSNSNAKWIGLWSIQKASIAITIIFWKVGKNVINDKNGSL